MTLAALIRKRQPGTVATAIPAIPAIQQGQSTGTVARIATIAIANSTALQVKAIARLDELIDRVATAHNTTPAEVVEMRACARANVSEAQECYIDLARQLDESGTKREAFDLEVFEERAAIIQFDGGYSRDDAERLALAGAQHLSASQRAFAEVQMNEWKNTGRPSNPAPVLEDSRKGEAASPFSTNAEMATRKAEPGSGFSTSAEMAERAGTTDRTLRQAKVVAAGSCATLKDTVKAKVAA